MSPIEAGEKLVKREPVLRLTSDIFLSRRIYNAPSQHSNFSQSLCKNFQNVHIPFSHKVYLVNEFSFIFFFFIFCLLCLQSAQIISRRQRINSLKLNTIVLAVGWGFTFLVNIWHFYKKKKKNFTTNTIFFVSYQKWGKMLI